MKACVPNWCTINIYLWKFDLDQNMFLVMLFNDFWRSRIQNIDQQIINNQFQIDAWKIDVKLCQHYENWSQNRSRMGPTTFIQTINTSMQTSMRKLTWRPMRGPAFPVHPFFPDLPAGPCTYSGKPGGLCQEVLGRGTTSVVSRYTSVDKKIRDSNTPDRSERVGGLSSWYFIHLFLGLCSISILNFMTLVGS